jgi:ribulose-phosphate 3-epimerase
MNRPLISPSLLSANFANLQADIEQINRSDADWLHIDIMDGVFVPSISFGFPIIRSIRKLTDKFFDVHLMIEEPGRYIEEFKKSGADMLTVHAEACKHLDSTLREIRKAGMKVGVAINPGTPVSQLECVLDLVDMVLIMTVNPGFGGQSYIESCTGKVQKLRKMITEAGLDVDIQVDGGINEKTIDKVLDAGANILVAGSAVFGGNIGENVRCLKEKMESR